MNERDWRVLSEPSEIVRKLDGSPQREVWALPVEEEFLESFLRDIFENHWDGIRFGPMIPGAAYELRCPGPPKKIGLLDGYLTLMFGNGGHFHLCIGEFMGSAEAPTPPEERAHRRPSKAQIFRGYGRDRKPSSWGFEMWNGHGEPMISIFFPNPFLDPDDTLPEASDFTRLTAWRAIAKRWLGRDPEPIDAEGRGFRAGS